MQLKYVCSLLSCVGLQLLFVHIRCLLLVGFCYGFCTEAPNNCRPLALKVCRISETSILVINPTPTPISWRMEDVSFIIKGPKREAFHSRPELPILRKTWAFCLCNLYLISYPFASRLLLLPTVALCHCRLRCQLRRLVLFLDVANVFKIFGNTFAYLVSGMNFRRRYCLCCFESLEEKFFHFQYFHVVFSVFFATSPFGFFFSFNP